MENGDASKDPSDHMETEVNDEDDDPIVQEIPVFLSKTLVNNLYLFQYPVRPANMTYDSSVVLSSRVRPRNQQVELAIALHTDSASYDISKGEQIALNVDGSDVKGGKTLPKNDENSLYSSGLMDKQVLSSSKSIEDVGRYAVGILGGNELHITPLKGIVSLRPNMSYLDKSDRTAKAEGRAVENTEDLTTDDESDELKPVTVRFSKNDQDSAKKAREKTFEFQQKKLEEEAWVPARFHQLKSAMWDSESQKLFCRKMDEEICNLNATSNEYLDSLTSTASTSSTSKM